MLLSQEFDTLSKVGNFDESPRYLKENLNPNFELRDYQKESFKRFIYYFEKYPKTSNHLLFNMATGSGKTLVMAGLMLYLYKKGYRKFLFFVNSENIIEKTKDNFLNEISGKYLFNDKILIDGREVKVKEVGNFVGVDPEGINVCFTTIQKLHGDLSSVKENSITFEDFEREKIVLLADESHHLQKKTKQKTLINNEKTWENTVIEIFKRNKENVLLEFTATQNLDTKDLEKKYSDKLIYKYDLKKFRNDGFSKDVQILRLDADKKERILLALVLNQYRQDVASKHKINLKPVILFKTKNTIKQSEENKKFFHQLIENLKEEEIEELKNKVDIKEIRKAFDFYEKEDIRINVLVKKLQTSFAENKCLNMNDKDKNPHQKVNSLEDKNNQIRAIFSVQKLTEGWDVLNLYDIVRLDESQSGSGQGSKISPSTISEAQLIGRGARYFPFKLEESDDKFKRKFDKDLENGLRILEELHFHSINESDYISELKRALLESGLIDDDTEEKRLKLKDKFKHTDFYKSGVIYLNEKIRNDFSDFNSFKDLGIEERPYEIPSLKGKIDAALTDASYDNLNVQKDDKTLEMSEIPIHVIRAAIARRDFFKFDNVKKHFPKVNSIFDVIKGKEYLSEFRIKFHGVKKDIDEISNQHLFKSVLDVLDKIEKKIKDDLTDYKGSKEFKPKKISKIFSDKTISLKKFSERSRGQTDFLKDKDWYAFESNYGTSEEKKCVELLRELIEQKFKKKYDKIYLIRNELHFKIFNFRDGKGFSPDFILFMKNKKGKIATYQIFIEPKGQHLIKKDEWKQDFLHEIKKTFSHRGLTNFAETPEYRLSGVRFYNHSEERGFEEDLLNSLGYDFKSG